MYTFNADAKVTVFVVTRFLDGLAEDIGYVLSSWKGIYHLR